MSENIPDISVVVPVYGGEKTIRTLVEQTAEVMQAEGWKHEFILVCDHPRDCSWEVARELAETRPEVISILLRRNFGQHPATLLGIRRARGTTIVTMDEDLQHDPSDLPTLIRASQSEEAIAYGVADELKHAWWRNATSRTAKFIVARYLGFHANDVSAFRAFPAAAREAFHDYRGERVAIDVLLSWAGAPVKSIRCQYQRRDEGESGYTFKKLVGYLLDLVLGYSTAPLRLASWLGIAAFFLAFAIAGYVLFTWLIHGSVVPGFAFLGLTIAVFAGVQLLSLGLIGEYLGRLYFNALGKPQYLVGSVVGAPVKGTTEEVGGLLASDEHTPPESKSRAEAEGANEP
ncbi:MAG: undecaprenyl-phosphate 4-deoxy-4-formamido-L-arabinose transferase [Bradymonadia bacterium]